MISKYKELVVIMLAFAAALPTALVIRTFGVNVPYWDEWDSSAFIAIHASEGFLPIAFIFAQHNEHRIVFSKFTVAVSTWLTNWDTRFEMWVSFGLAVLTFLLLFDMLRRESPSLLWLGIPLAWLVFSVRQSHNWLAAFQTCFLYISLFSTLTVWLLVRLDVGWRALWAMALSTFAASWSLSSGLPLWIAMLPGLWLRGYRKWQHYVFWVLATAFCLWLYFKDLIWLEVGRGQGTLLDYLVFILRFLGSPFVPERPESLTSALLIGAAGIVLFCWNVFSLRRHLSNRLLAASFVFFLLGVANATITAQGRIGFSLGSPMQPIITRYVTIANFMWIGLLLVIAVSFTQKIRISTQHLNKLTLIIAALLYTITVIQTISVMPIREAFSPSLPILPSPEERTCVMNVVFSHDKSCFLKLFPYSHSHINTVQELAKRRLTTFTDWQVDFAPAQQPAFAHVQPILGIPDDVNRLPRWMNDGDGVALLQPPPSTAEQYLQLPNAPQVFFEAEIDVALHNEPEQVDTPLIEANFRLGIREGREVRFIYEARFDRDVGAPLPIQVNLSQWRGKAVTVVYQTHLVHGDPSYAWVMWRNPRVVTDSAIPSQPALASLKPLAITSEYLRWIKTAENIRLFQHPPSLAEQELRLPDAPQVFFEAEIYVDLENIRRYPNLFQSGASFRLSLREGGRVQKLYESAFDVNVETAPIPIRIDLSAWRGKVIVLIYETRLRQDNPTLAWAMWHNPRVVTYPPAATQPAFADLQPIGAADANESRPPHWIKEADEAILFQHPPSIAEQRLQLPYAPVFFEAEIYVDLRNVREHPDVPQTGADFRLSLRDEQVIHTLYEGSFDVNVETAPIPIRADLSRWRGKVIFLVYETLVRQGNPNFAWAMWRNPRLVVSLPPAAQPALAPLQPSLGVVGSADNLPRWIRNTEGIALFQHPPNIAEQPLQLPDAPQVFFEAEIYVDLQHIREHPDVPQTGADFRLGIREGRQVRTLYEGGFDVNVETAPIPIRVDLSAWRGKAVVLVYETLVREGNPNFAWAMWRNPRLVTQ